MFRQMFREIVPAAEEKQASKESTMNRYLIEVPHDPTHAECARMSDSFCRAGIHYMTNADWGCEDGIHSSWLTVEALSAADAALVVPPALRSRARIVRLSRYTVDDLAEEKIRIFGTGALQAMLV